MKENNLHIYLQCNVSQMIYRNIKFHIQMYMKFNNISNSALQYRS